MNYAMEIALVGMIYICLWYWVEGFINIPRFMMIGSGSQALLKFCFSSLGIGNVDVDCARDLWCAPLRWRTCQVSWRLIQAFKSCFQEDIHTHTGDLVSSVLFFSKSVSRLKLVQFFKAFRGKLISSLKKIPLLLRERRFIAMLTKSKY
jgi:uncharacterized membrane protein YwzB